MSQKKSPQWSKKSSKVTPETKSQESKLKTEVSEQSSGTSGFEEEKSDVIPSVVEGSLSEDKAILRQAQNDKDDIKEVPKAWEEGDKIDEVPPTPEASEGHSSKESADSNELEEIKSSKVKDRLLMLVGVVLWLTVFGMTGGVMYYQYLGSWRVDTKETAETVQSTPTPSVMTKSEISKSTKIMVLNASGVVGAAGKLKKYLEGKGYTSVEAGNAPDEVSSSSVNLPKNTVMLEELSTLLSDYGLENLTVSESDSDILEIIIGKK